MKLLLLEVRDLYLLKQAPRHGFQETVCLFVCFIFANANEILKVQLWVLPKEM